MPPLRKAVSITHPSMQREREKCRAVYGWGETRLGKTWPALAADSTVSFGQKQGQLPVWVGSGQRSGSAALLAEFTVNCWTSRARITRYIRVLACVGR